MVRGLACVARATGTASVWPEEQAAGLWCSMFGMCLDWCFWGPWTAADERGCRMPSLLQCHRRAEANLRDANGLFPSNLGADPVTSSTLSRALSSPRLGALKCSTHSPLTQTTWQDSFLWTGYCKTCFLCASLRRLSRTRLTSAGCALSPLLRFAAD